MTTEDKRKQMEQLTNRINQAYQKKRGTTKNIVLSPDDPSLKAERVECGIAQVDTALGGGFIRGAMHTIHGQEGTGKTCLALQLAAVLTNREEYVLYLNLEPPFPEEMVDHLGINRDYFKLIVARDYAEEVVDVVESYLYDTKKRQANDLVGCLIIDSLNNLVPKREIDKLEEKGSEGEMVAARALLIDKLMRRIQGRNMLENGCIVVLIVQDRAKLDAQGKQLKYEMSAGYSVRYNPKVRIYLGKKTLQRKDGDPGVKIYPGHTITVRVEKNNVTNGPLLETEYTVIRGQGVDDMERVLQDGMDLGWVYGDGDIGRSFYRFLIGNPNLVVKGKPNLTKALRAHPTLLSELRGKTKGPEAKKPPAPTEEYFLYDPEVSLVETEESPEEVEE